MDARLSAEQAELRDAAARLAGDLGPHSVLDLDDADRVARLEKALASTGWRTLRSDGASGVEIALVAEELARGLVDVPFLGRVLADALRLSAERPSTEATTLAVPAPPARPTAPSIASTSAALALATSTASPSKIPSTPPNAPGTRPATATRIASAAGLTAIDARGATRALTLDGTRLLAAPVGEPVPGVDLTRASAPLTGPLEPAGEISAAHAARWRALAIVVTTAEMVGAARGAHSLAVEYSKVRAQYGQAIGSYQAIAHLLAEGLALIEGCESILRYAAWAVDEMRPAEASKAARIAKVYCQDAARGVCEAAIQVHGGIGNTWECLAHAYLRRVLVSAETFPVRLEEIDVGLPGLRTGGQVPGPASRVAHPQRPAVRADRR